MFILSLPRSCLVLSLTLQAWHHIQITFRFIRVVKKPSHLPLNPRGFILSSHRSQWEQDPTLTPCLASPYCQCPDTPSWKCFRPLHQAGWAQNCSLDVDSSDSGQHQPLGAVLGAPCQGYQAPRPEGWPPSTWAQMPWSWRHSRSDWTQL